MAPPYRLSYRNASQWRHEVPTKAGGKEMFEFGRSGEGLEFLFSPGLVENELLHVRSETSPFCNSATFHSKQNDV